MQLKKFLILTTILICATTAAQENVQRKTVGKTHSRSQMIAELSRQVDSLQKAYDSLYVEYQSVLEPINTQDLEDRYLDSLIQEIDFTPDNIDSLASAYYSQSGPASADYAIENDFERIERENYTSSIPDSVYVQRLRRINSYIPLQFNQHVKNTIIYYTDKIPFKTQEIISKAPYYLPQFEEIFDRYDMPKELKAMAVIESALNPMAVSRAKAKGMWQFIYTTGRRYGLNITSFVDERFDPIKSCEAAAQYLRDAYLIFGDWQLAIASYNCGAGNVRKAIRRSGGRTGFWDIYDYLPRETRGYIPAFIAALYILEYHNEHGIMQKQVCIPAHIDTFHVNRMLHFKQVSDNIGIPIEVLRQLNPQYLHDIIPGTEREYVLNLPYNYTGAFADRENEIYSYQDSILFSEVAIKKIVETGSSDDNRRIVHKVKKGESLGGIASRYGVTIANLKRWNGLKGNTIRIGQKLAIYGKAASSTSGSSVSRQPLQSSGGYLMYTVKKGDNLTAIANRYGITLSQLLKINNFTTKSTIYPGMKIRVKKEQ